MNRPTLVAVAALTGLMLALVAAVAPATAAAEGRYDYEQSGSRWYVSLGGLGGQWRTGVLSSPSLSRFETDADWYLNLQLGEQGTTGLHYVFDAGFGLAGNDDQFFRLMPLGLRLELAMPNTPSGEEGFSLYIGLQAGTTTVRDDGTEDRLGYLTAGCHAGLSYYSGSFFVFGEAVFAYGESMFGIINDEWEGRSGMNDEVSYYREYGVRIGVGIRF